MATVRQSTVGSWGKCSYKIKLGRQYGYRTSIVRVLGTAVHKAHEIYYLERKEGRQISTSNVFVDGAIAELDDEVEKSEQMDWQFQAQTKYKDEVILDREQSIKWITELVKMYHDQKWYYPLDWEILGVEETFTIPLPDSTHQAHGTMDLMMKDPRGNIVCADHKTSKEFVTKSKYTQKNSIQASYYTWATSVILGVPLDGIQFYFDVLSWAPRKAGRGKTIDPTARFERFNETRTPEQVHASLKHANIVGDLMEKDAYVPNTDGWWCSKNFCDYFNECEYGKTYAISL
tara:strand:- start:2829 stop:3695 length:867 start_codon:yes stop_codon:yes gene_type:complete